MPTFCEKCGTPLQDGDVFCPNCGKTTQQSPSQQQAQPKYRQPQHASYGYSGQTPYQLPPDNKRIIVTVAVTLVLIAAVLVGLYYFKYKPNKERAEKALEQSMSFVINSQRTATPQKTETPAAKPQQSMEPVNVKVKEAEFFGVTLPIPDIGTVTENKTIDKGYGNEQIIIRYDGISYQEYIEYCKLLESLDGWKSLRKKSKDFKEDYNSYGNEVVFSGYYQSPLYVNVYYLSDNYSEHKELPHFALELLNF